MCVIISYFYAHYYNTYHRNCNILYNMYILDTSHSVYRYGSLLSYYLLVIIRRVNKYSRFPDFTAVC